MKVVLSVRSVPTDSLTLLLASMEPATASWAAMAR